MKVTGSFRAEESVVDSAGFTLAMHAADIDREFSGRLFEHLDPGAHWKSTGHRA